MYSMLGEPVMRAGSGAEFPLRLFREDPTQNRDLTPFLITQVTVTVPSLDEITPELVNEAVAKRVEEVRVEESAKAQTTEILPTQIRNMINRSVPHGRTESIKKGR